MSNSLKRRTFIGAGAAGALAMQARAASKASDAKPPKAKKKEPSCKIGLILYTIRDFLKTEDDIARSLEKVKKIGYECVEITSCEAVSPSRLAQLLKDNGLQAVSGHTSWEDASKNPQKIIDANQAYGNKHVVVSYMPDPLQNEEGFPAFAQGLSEAGAKFAEAGMTFGYHNHSFEFTKYSGKTGQEILITQSDPRYLSFELDTYWVQYGGGDPAAWIHMLAGRIPIVHMKDMVSQGKNPVYAEVGEGNMN
ncbi:MAG: sugar phosphate isomerase/epimerase family protein, partial [Candidatus Hinthialibacter sp.]